MHAVRNTRLCMKDCLCLYVCPTGATNTETGQIDIVKCIGCGMCAKACPHHALTIVPDTYPVQQPKRKDVVEPLYGVLRNKVEAELVATSLCDSEDPVARTMAVALRESFRRQSEDMVREAGYMLPQSKNVRDMLEHIAATEMDPNFPTEAVLSLLRSLQVQDR